MGRRILLERRLSGLDHYLRIAWRDVSAQRVDYRSIGDVCTIADHVDEHVYRLLVSVWPRFFVFSIAPCELSCLGCSEGTPAQLMTSVPDAWRHFVEQSANAVAG